MSFATPNRRGFLREAALVAAAMLAYFLVRNLTVGSAEEAFANAERIVDVEQWAHIGWEEDVQASIAGSDFLVMLANWIYIWGHWPVIIGTAIALHRYRPERYHLLRNALFVSGAIGFLFFALFPVAPPRLLDLGLVDTVTEQSQAYRALQPPGLTNQYAAFPSLHFGWNFVVGIVLLTTTTRIAVRLFAVASPLAMGFAVIATANHFVVDVAAGLLVVLVGLAAAYAIERRRSRKLHSAPVGRQLASRLSAGGQHPFLVAHRAGNRLADLWAAEHLRSTLVEADVRLYRGRLEVRHLKTAGPLPVLWDRWQVVAPWRPRLQLYELLAATSDETELMLDLKGRNERLATLALAAIEPYFGRRRFTVCARRWSMLDAFAGHPVRRVHSVGNARQLRRLLSRFAGQQARRRLDTRAPARRRERLVAACDR